MALNVSDKVVKRKSTNFLKTSPNICSIEFQGWSNLIKQIENKKYYLNDITHLALIQAAGEECHIYLC